MSNQNTEKSPGIEFALFSRTCEMRMNNFGCLNSSLSSFYYYAYNEPPPPPPYTRQYAFSWATCTLSNRTEPAITYMFKVNNRNIRTRCEMYSKLTINILLTLNIFHTLF